MPISSVKQALCNELISITMSKKVDSLRYFIRCCVRSLAQFEGKELILVFSHKLRYIVGFGLAEMTTSTNHKPTSNPKPTINRNLSKTGPAGLPANIIHSPNVGSMLDQRHRWSLNIEPTLGGHLVFAGFASMLM